MKKHLVGLALVLALLGTLSLRAEAPATDDPGKRADIKKLLELTGTRQLALQAIDQMIGQFKKTMPQVPAEFWKDAAAEMRMQIDELLDLQLPVYEKHLSHEDIKGLIKFYESPVGKKFVKAQPAIQMECMQAGQKWGQKIGQKIGKKLQERNQ